MILLLPFLTVKSQNPIASFYNGSEGYPAWTDEVKWSNKINMASYTNGADNFEKFKNACNEMYLAGGGVMYYPGGIYTFDISDDPNGEGLMLRPGVVVLGQEPTTDKKAVTSLDILNIDSHGLTSNPTIFVFSKKTINLAGDVPKMWNMIGCKPSTAELVGVAWIEMEFGYIFLGFSSTAWGATWATSGGWLGAKSVNGWGARIPDGTHPLDALAASTADDNIIQSSKRFVFGVHMKNACVTNYAINKPGLTGFTVEQGSFRFAARLCVYGSHVFVANNCISKPEASNCFRFAVNSLANGFQEQIFDYAKGGSIDVNKSLTSQFDNKCDVSSNNSFYAEDVFVKDNWLFNHANKGIEVSGNVNSRQPYDKTDIYGGSNLTYVV